MNFRGVGRPSNIPYGEHWTARVSTIKVRLKCSLGRIYHLRGIVTEPSDLSVRVGRVNSKFGVVFSKSL